MSTSEVQVSNRKGRPNYPQAYTSQVAMAASDPAVSVAKVALAPGLNTCSSGVGNIVPGC